MNKRKMEKLKAAGWKVGNAEDFLELSQEELLIKALTHYADHLEDRLREMEIELEMVKKVALGVPVTPGE